jgi:hypothetical protein
MRRLVEENHEPEGLDSFLDMITNLVGILVILVIVAGMRGKDQAVAALTGQSPPALSIATKPAVKSPAKPTVDPAQLQKVRTEAERLASEHRQTEQQMAELEQQAELLKYEHNRHRQTQSQLTELLALGKVRLEELRSKLSGDAQQDFDLQRQIQAAQVELQQLEKAAAAAITTSAPTIEIAANGTPISKLVDGDEVHFQLRDGRIAYVPMEELVDMARREMKPELDRLKTLSQLQEATEREFTTPTRRGFEMRYALMFAADRTGNRVSISMSRFEIHPVQSILGETPAEALAPQSQFRTDIQKFGPRTTTITLWTYPDSFAVYRAVQDELRRAGYQVAGRLMPASIPIGGSPHGKKSLSQ